jgi:hypothetical protein
MTNEEALHQGELLKQVSAVIKCIGTIVADGRNEGEVNCPVCGTIGGVKFRYVGPKKHIRAQCITSKCIEFMS